MAETGHKTDKILTDTEHCIVLSDSRVSCKQFVLASYDHIWFWLRPNFKPFYCWLFRFGRK